jgi:hypothetical protein
MLFVACHTGVAICHSTDRVIVVQRVPVVASHAVREKLGMVMVEQERLVAASVIGVPVERHHIGEIVRAHVGAPAIPIEDSDVVAAAGPR